MVSTPSTSKSSTTHQYITDYVPITGGKSPLAMLAKTCETIGLPETPARKSGSSSSSPSDKKGSSPNGKKENTKAAASPKGPITHSFPAALGFPPMASFPFMAFPSLPPSFSSIPPSLITPPSMMAMMGMKPPCPALLMGRPCTQPGCPSCAPAVSSSFDAMNPFMNPAAYQAFIAAAAAAATSAPSTTTAGPFIPSTLSLPSTSTPSTSSSSSVPSSSSSSSTTRSSSSTRHSCAWAGCDKQFDTPDDLTFHLKDHVANSSTPSTPTPSEKTSPKILPSSSISSSASRYNPYSKPSMIPTSLPSMPLMPMTMNPLLMSGLFPQMRLPIP